MKQPRQKRSKSDSRQRRLEKNRQSARESRKRKKTYIEALELKIEAVQAENVRLRTQNQNLRERRKINFLSNVSQIDEFLSGRQELYERLSNTMENGASQQEICAIIENLRQRSGTYGVQRKDLINNLFKGIVDLSFPQFVKYLFWGSSHNVGLFESIGEVQDDVKQGNQPFQRQDVDQMQFDDMSMQEENEEESFSGSIKQDNDEKSLRQRRRVKNGATLQLSQEQVK